MRLMGRLIFGVLPLLIVGCVSVDEEALKAHQSIAGGRPAEAVVWGEELATDSVYSENRGMVEAGRIQMLAGDMSKAEEWFRKAVDSAVDRKERAPKISLGDAANTAMAATITDDRTQNYYLSPYEINLALEYEIIAQVMNGKREDALVDCRLSAYIQDNLAQTYGADMAKTKDSSSKESQAANGVCDKQNAEMAEVMASTRNSWENPVLWWLTGVLFEADGDVELALQSYRRAKAIRPECAPFAASVEQLVKNRGKRPLKEEARLVVVYEEGLVPMRQSLKIPVPIYTGMAIDLPIYKDKTPYTPSKVALSGAQGLVAATPAMDIRALAYRDLSEHLPGVVTRNITRAALQAGTQAAVNCATDNGYARIAVFAANAVVSMLRRADTRSWISLPDGQQVFDEVHMKPGTYQIGVNVNGRTTTVPVTLGAGETHLVWIADLGNNFIYKENKL